MANYYGPIEEDIYPSDVFHRIDESLCNISVKIKSFVALNQFQILGQPVIKNGDDWVLCLGGDEQDVKGIIYTKEKLTLAANASSECQVAIAVRGNLELNRDKLPTLDAAGDTFNIPGLVSIYEGLGDIHVKDEIFTEVFSREGF